MDLDEVFSRRTVCIAEARKSGDGGEIPISNFCKRFPANPVFIRETANGMVG
jgi:hypothetical protein